MGKRGVATRVGDLDRFPPTGDNGEQFGIFEGLALGAERERAPTVPSRDSEEGKGATRRRRPHQQQVRKRLTGLAHAVALVAPAGAGAEVVSCLASEIDYTRAQGAAGHSHRRPSRESPVSPSLYLRVRLQHCGGCLAHDAGLLLVPGQSLGMLKANVGQSQGPLEVTKEKSEERYAHQLLLRHALERPNARQRP